MGDPGEKLYLLFVWHMHQPDYFDPEQGETVLPWVRLHGCSGYTDMPFHLARHPGIKATFNFSGTLLGDLEGFPADERRDRYRDLSLKLPADLAYEERIFILKHFFSLSPRRIRSSQRLCDLLGKRGRSLSSGMMPKVMEKFGDQDILDIQVLFNLLFFGKAATLEFDFIREMKLKGKGFTQEEKEKVLGIQDEVCAGVLQRYKDLLSAGQVEVSFTPYFHPILPLLLDSGSASEGLPGVPLPERFSFPEDARRQVQEGEAASERVFGRKPGGMWPSEGSVSDETLRMASDLASRTSKRLCRERLDAPRPSS